MGASVFILLRAFANGGSSLTGLEAISNGASAFRPPEGRNARRVLVVMSLVLGSLVAGVSLLAAFTHATPYISGFPTVISQEAQEVFGHSVVGNGAYYVFQAATMLISVHRCEYQLQRLPVPGELRRGGLVPAAPAHHPWAPAGLLPGDRAAVNHRDRDPLATERA